MNPTQRFSSRVADYVQHRPSYPPALIEHLQHEKILTPNASVADLGSGTGIFTELLLPHAARVFAIEPNPDMRSAAEQRLAHHPNFSSVAAPAEATTLPDHTIDLITAAQAFHWFDRPAAKNEFARILRPGSGRPARPNVALLWNERLANTPFLVAYDALLKQFSTDYAAVDHRRMTDDLLADFFAPSPPTLTTLPNSQSFNYDSLQGRLLSSSYAPPAGHPQHAPMLAALKQIFDAHHDGRGHVHFAYQTKLYLAQFTSDPAP